MDEKAVPKGQTGAVNDRKQRKPARVTFSRIYRGVLVVGLVSLWWFSLRAETWRIISKKSEVLKKQWRWSDVSITIELPSLMEAD